MIKLKDLGHIDIKKVDNNTLSLIIKIINMFGTEEKYMLTLNKKELDDKMRIDLMNEKIKNLENIIKEINQEKDEMKTNINNLTNENKLIKSELNDLKMIINSIINIGFKSAIINNKNEINFILDEIEKKQSKQIKNINLIYNATEDGDKIDIFHSKCDDKNNTLMIIKTKEDYIFGGFTKSGWKNVKGEDISDDKAFCFSYNLKKIYNIKKPKHALHCQSRDSRPSFGCDSYSFLIQNDFLSNNSTADKMTDYIGEEKEIEINGGNPYFQIIQMEVFQISF